MQVPKGPFAGLVPVGTKLGRSHPSGAFQQEQLIPFESCSVSDDSPAKLLSAWWVWKTATVTLDFVLHEHAPLTMQPTPS